MSIDGQYSMQQQGWVNTCSQPEWQQGTQYTQSGGNGTDSWGYAGAPYPAELPRVPPMYHPGLTEPGYGQNLQCPQDYTWGKNLLDASNYIHHFGNHASTVARRNERERNRVRHINSTFDNLRQHLPCSSKKKKLSKVDTLRTAIKYINHLQNILGKDIKPLTQKVKQEPGALSSLSSSDAHSSSSHGTSAFGTSNTALSTSKRQSLDSSTASNSSLENTLGQGDELDDEATEENCSSPGSSAADRTPVPFLEDAPFQWSSSS